MVAERGGRLVGLSPRVRGNPKGCPDGLGQTGSIPARAGEPGSAAALRRSITVYPRACGGTRHVMGAYLHYRGLSPARAGEPLGFSDFRYKVQVYPRACGGT